MTLEEERKKRMYQFVILVGSILIITLMSILLINLALREQGSSGSSLLEKYEGLDLRQISQGEYENEIMKNSSLWISKAGNPFVFAIWTGEEWDCRVPSVPSIGCEIQQLNSTEFAWRLWRLENFE